VSTVIEHPSSWVQTRTQGIFSIPVPFGSGGAAKVGVDITPLDITITPAKVGNYIEIEFVIFGIGNNPSFESGFFLKRNGVNLADTTDGSDNYYAVNSITDDRGGTDTAVPQVHLVTLVDKNSLGIASTYTIAVRHTSSTLASSTNFYLNRAILAPQAGSESGLSTAIITEYDL
jgi:hypothetical protein